MASDTPERPSDDALDELFYRHDQVPFVYWREFTGAKTAVLLVGAVAVVAFVAGLSRLSQGTGGLDGPLARFLPAGAVDPVRLAGVLLAFLLAVAAAGLRRSKRLAWNGTVLLLLGTALLPLATARPTDVLLSLLALVTLPLVVWNRDRFDQPIDLTPFQVAAVAAFVAVQVYGTLGAYVLREQYTGIETWTDAFYYIVVTGTTVGYGDATPVTGEAKLFTLSVLIVGTAAFGVAFGALLVPALESRMTAAFGNMTASELTLLEDHVLILGYGDLTEPIVEELATTTDLVVVTPDAEVASALQERGVSVLTADPTDREALLDARADTAVGVVAATDDDATNTLAVLAAKQANPDVRVVAAASDARHVDKLEEVGADAVVSPSVIGGRLLGRSVLGDDSPIVEDVGDPAIEGDASDDGDAAT